MFGVIGLILYLISAALIWGILHLKFLRNSSLIVNVIVYIIIFGCINTFVQSPAILIIFVIVTALIFFILLRLRHAHMKQVAEETEKKKRIEAIHQRKRDQQLKEQKRAEETEKKKEQEEYEQHIDNLYHILGCNPNDDFSKVRVQYRRLMQQYNYDYNNPKVGEIDKCYHKIRKLQEKSFIKNNNLGDF